MVLDEKQRLIDINRITYFGFFFFNLLTIYWVGGWGAETDPFLMIAGGLLLFVNPVFFLIPSTLFYFSRKLLGRRAAFFLFPFFFITYEYLYMITDASFPWVTIGNGLAYFTTFIQIADILGALGLSLLVVFINVFIFEAAVNFRRNRKLSLLFAASALPLFILPLIYGSVYINNYRMPGRSIRTGMIQPNLNPWDKWGQNNLPVLLENYLELSEKAADQGAKLIIWPETALPVYLMDGQYRGIVDSIYSFLDRRNVYLLAGMPDFRFFGQGDDIPADAKFSRVNEAYYATYNSVLLFSPYDRRVHSYGKMKLVPFGERVPFVDKLPFLGDIIKWNVGISGWNVGRDTVVFSLMRPEKRDTVHVNSLVCFESVFPDFVSGFSLKGSDMIAVVTNDSWYGNSSGPYQHKEIAALRAVENRRSVVRAANGGISTIIDPLGRTVVQSSMYTRTQITGDVPLESKLTFYARHPLIIPTLAWIISLITALWFAAKKIMEKLQRRQSV